jgi:hypothetical protein
MSRRAHFAVYVLLSVVDFGATVFLVTHGYADEANPLIRGFAGHFASFAMGLAIYKLAMLIGLVMMLRIVHRKEPRTSLQLLAFANAAMLALTVWHGVCLRASLG